MASEDEIMAVDKRRASLEETVAKGFHEQGQQLDRLDGRVDRLDSRVDRLDGRVERLDGRMGRLEDRMFSLESKVDVGFETMRGEIKTVLEAVTAGTQEMRRTTEAMRKEHEADRRLTRAILLDHSHRIPTIEA